MGNNPQKKKTMGNSNENALKKKELSSTVLQLQYACVFQQIMGLSMDRM